MKCVLCKIKRWPPGKTREVIGGAAAICLIIGFCSGLLLAFGTGQALWLVLTAVCWIILGAG